ncbi:MAG: hypothetical protein HY544_05665, partial [Candidatus Diapherotrites archaeon]|nr:hypothetical protein [Candidatus Diapherotrites archaeon]
MKNGAKAQAGRELKAAVGQKTTTAAGAASGAASILGSWQVCHNVCLGLIALLGIIGITVTGMPLLFLTKIAVPAWLAAVALLGVTVYMYARHRCISPNLLILNSGLIIAGVPFQQGLSLQPLWWSMGGAVALGGVALFIRERISRRKCHA